MRSPISSSGASVRQQALVCASCEKEGLVPTSVSMEASGEQPSATIHLQCGFCGTYNNLIVEHGLGAEDWEGDAAYGIRTEQVQ